MYWQSTDPPSCSRQTWGTMCNSRKRLEIALITTVALVMTRGAIRNSYKHNWWHLAFTSTVAHGVEKKIAAVQCTVLWAMVYAFELFCAFSCIPHNSSLKLELVRIESNLSSSCCLVSWPHGPRKPYIHKWFLKYQTKLRSYHPITGNDVSILARLLSAVIPSRHCKV